MQQLTAHCVWIGPSDARATNADGSYPESALLLGRSGIITLAGPLLAPRHSRGDGLANACFDPARESCKSSLYSSREAFKLYKLMQERKSAQRDTLRPFSALLGVIFALLGLNEPHYRRPASSVSVSAF